MNNYVWLHGGTGEVFRGSAAKKTIYPMEIDRHHLENRMFQAIVASREGRSMTVL